MPRAKVMQLNQAIRCILLLVAFLASASSGFAAGKQFHVRAGMLKGSYSGPLEASFTVIPSIDIEMELFQNARVSTLVHANFSMDMAKAKVFYSGVGIGQRYYLGAPGMLFDRIESDYSIEAFAKNRYFVGWEVGVAQVLVQEFTATYSIVGSVVELGVLGGYIYQLNKNLGLVVAAGGAYGMGFTTVSVNGLHIRANAGISYYF